MHIKNNQYKEGFYTKIKNDQFAKGINKIVIKKISKKRNEPKWMLNFRLKSYYTWKKMKEPHWMQGTYKNINYKKIRYFSAPHNQKYKNKNNQNQYLTKEVKYTFNKLNIPVSEKNNIAVDAIFDSVSVSTTYEKKLYKQGIIFCSLSQAIQKYPKLVKKYLGSVVSYKDNFFSALNSAVASDGTFIYIPKNIKCPIELSTYFRINAKKTGQFERTIIIADKNSYVSYIEGCSAPNHKNFKLHAAVVEVILLKNSCVKYSTIQNWFSGNKNNNGVVNFVTKRAKCIGKKSHMSWIQVETGSAITWKYPSVILLGKYSKGEFFSIALTKKTQQADTGTKMIHVGKHTKSTIISKGIAMDKSYNTYRSLVTITKNAKKSRNFTQCHSMLIGNLCQSHTFPSLKSKNNTSTIEHEASASQINQNQLFYCQQRGISEDNAISMIVNGFCKDIISQLPLEFSIEARDLLTLNLLKTVG